MTELTEFFKHISYILIYFKVIYIAYIKVICCLKLDNGKFVTRTINWFLRITALLNGTKVVMLF